MEKKRSIESKKNRAKKILEINAPKSKSHPIRNDLCVKIHPKDGKTDRLKFSLKSNHKKTNII